MSDGGSSDRAGPVAGPSTGSSGYSVASTSAAYPGGPFAPAASTSTASHFTPLGSFASTAPPAPPFYLPPPTIPSLPLPPPPSFAAPSAGVSPPQPAPAFDAAAFPAIPQQSDASAPLTATPDTGVSFSVPSFNLAAFSPFADLSHGLNGVDDFFQSLDLEIAAWDSLPTATGSAEPSPAEQPSITALGSAGAPPPPADADENERIDSVDPTCACRPLPHVTFPSVLTIAHSQTTPSTTRT